MPDSQRVLHETWRSDSEVIIRPSLSESTSELVRAARSRAVKTLQESKSDDKLRALNSFIPDAFDFVSPGSATTPHVLMKIALYVQFLSQEERTISNCLRRFMAPFVPEEDAWNRLLCILWDSADKAGEKYSPWKDTREQREGVLERAKEWILGHMKNEIGVLIELGPDTTNLEEKIRIAEHCYEQETSGRHRSIETVLSEQNNGSLQVTTRSANQMATRKRAAEGDSSNSSKKLKRDSPGDQLETMAEISLPTDKLRAELLAKDKRLARLTIGYTQVQAQINEYQAAQLSDRAKLRKANSIVDHRERQLCIADELKDRHEHDLDLMEERLGKTIDLNSLLECALESQGVKFREANELKDRCQQETKDLAAQHTQELRKANELNDQHKRVRDSLNDRFRKGCDINFILEHSLESQRVKLREANELNDQQEQELQKAKDLLGQQGQELRRLAELNLQRNCDPNHSGSLKAQHQQEFRRVNQLNTQHKNNLNLLEQEIEKRRLQDESQQEEIVAMKLQIEQLKSHVASQERYSCDTGQLEETKRLKGMVDEQETQVILDASHTRDGTKQQDVDILKGQLEQKEAQIFALQAVRSCEFTQKEEQVNTLERVIDGLTRLLLLQGAANTSPAAHAPQASKAREATEKITTLTQEHEVQRASKTKEEFRKLTLPAELQDVLLAFSAAGTHNPAQEQRDIERLKQLVKEKDPKFRALSYEALTPAATYEEEEIKTPTLLVRQQQLQIDSPTVHNSESGRQQMEVERLKISLTQQQDQTAVFGTHTCGASQKQEQIDRLTLLVKQQEDQIASHTIHNREAGAQPEPEKLRRLVEPKNSEVERLKELVKKHEAMDVSENNQNLETKNQAREMQQPSEQTDEIQQQQIGIVTLRADAKGAEQLREEFTKLQREIMILQREHGARNGELRESQQICEQWRLAYEHQGFELKKAEDKLVSAAGDEVKNMLGHARAEVQHLQWTVNRQTHGHKMQQEMMDAYQQGNRRLEDEKNKLKEENDRLKMDNVELVRVHDQLKRENERLKEENNQLRFRWQDGEAGQPVREQLGGVNEPSGGSGDLLRCDGPALETRYLELEGRYQQLVKVNHDLEVKSRVHETSLNRKDIANKAFQKSLDGYVEEIKILRVEKEALELSSGWVRRRDQGVESGHKDV